MGAGTASALSEPKSTLLRNLSQTELKALIADIDAQGLNTSGSTSVKTGVGRMQMAAGKIPRLSTLGTVGVVATGSVIVWKIADAAGLGGFVYKKITGEAYGSTPPTYSYQWRYIIEGSGSVWSFSAGQDPGPSWVIEIPNQAYLYGSSYSMCQAFKTVAQSLTGTERATGGNGQCGAGTTWMKIRTQAQMERTVQIAPSTSGEYASPPAGATTQTVGTADSTISDPELALALDAIDPVPGTAGTAVEEDTAGAILDTLDPGWDSEYVLLPQPQLNETYDEYVLRLQAEGWLGTATSTVLATEQAGYGPDAVVRITYTPLNGTKKTLDPLRWPQPGPQIELNDDIVIRYNPPTAPPAPTEGPGTGGGGETGPACDCPPIDLSPLNVGASEKFPFGIFGYVTGFFAQFGSSTSPPSFSIGKPAGLGGGTLTVTAPEFTYKYVSDAVIKFVVVLSSIWFAGTWLIGWRRGDSLAE